MDAKVVEQTYLGSVTHLDLACDGQVLKACINQDAHTNFASGDEVVVEIPADNCRVLRS